MDFVQKSNCLLLALFTEFMSEKIVFRHFGKKTIIFRPKKLKFQQGPKNGHFLKGLVHGLCTEIELFLIGVFHRNHIRKNRS